jgi:hypothetical protein
MTAYRPQMQRPVRRYGARGASKAAGVKGVSAELNTVASLIRGLMTPSEIRGAVIS